MARSNYRSAYVVVAIAFASSIVPSARADGPPRDAESDVKAAMQCDRANEPGRVRCTVEVRVEGGRTLAWADVEILSLPDFASALKGRIGPQDALSHDATSTKWALGLVARRSGQGEARARVRVVTCDASRTSKCAPGSTVVTAQVAVSG
jgi:hypothetical protein